jgi:hypothetical protein
VLRAFGWLAVVRRRSLQECFERHANDVRRPASEATRFSPKRTAQWGGQSDRDLIVHKGLQSCTAIVVLCIAAGKVRAVLS